VDDNGNQHDDGLPAGQAIASLSNLATYQFQPANGNNVLQLFSEQTGTLTLANPAAYRTLYVLTASSLGLTPVSIGTGNIYFADGRTQFITYEAPDWCNTWDLPIAALPGTIGSAFIGSNGTSFLYNGDCPRQLYETVIPIEPPYAGVSITRIEFVGASDAGFSYIFAVSGS
jgi:hypothetical protein